MDGWIDCTYTCPLICGDVGSNLPLRFDLLCFSFSTFASSETLRTDCHVVMSHCNLWLPMCFGQARVDRADVDGWWQLRARGGTHAGSGKIIHSASVQRIKKSPTKSLESSPSEECFSIPILAVCISSLEDRNRDAYSSRARSVTLWVKRLGMLLLRVDERLLNPLLC